MTRPQHAAPRPQRRWGRLASGIALGLGIVLVLATAGAYLEYRKLNNNIDHIATNIVGARPADGPGKSENVLLIGSDSRAFAGGAHFGAEVTGARSDTTILVHISADGKKAILVSIPRDTYTQIPPCHESGGRISSPQWNKFNAAYSIGGPSCTIATVEHLTHLRIDHFVEVNFLGFQRMVDALGGVKVCLSHAIDDPVRTNPATGGTIGSGLVVSAGTHTFHGKDALGFVRARYAVGDGSDLGRIKNQQVFISAVIRKATSTGLILKPWRLLSFLNAATKSIRTDPGFGLSQLKKLAGELHGLTAGKVALLTVPLSNSNAYVPIGGVQASVVFWDKPRANALWHALRVDGPLPGTAPKPKPSSSASPAPSLLVAPNAIHVRVLNGTGQQNLAHKVAQDLAARGFIIDGVGDADSSGYTHTVVRYGADRNESSQTLAASVTGATRQLDGALSGTLELVVGSDYTGTQAVHISTPSAAPTPTASLDVVTADRAVCTS
ncbi:MAG TPA: LCP family protein [Mycobacteriales bacterium]|nr:LCP family protein [Mycobacteriales bacterium]